MAKFEVTHSCGCVETHQIVGAIKDRDRKAAYIGSGPCSECWGKQQAEARAKDSSVAAAAATAAGLPALQGSDKQIAWSESIRAKAMAVVAAARSQGVGAPAESRIFAACDACTTKLSLQTSAKWWIDSRGSLESFKGIFSALGLSKDQF